MHQSIWTLPLVAMVSARADSLLISQVRQVYSPALYRSLSLGYVDDKGRSVADMQGTLEANLIAERFAQSFD